MNRPRRYPSDTSDTEWEITAPYITVRGTRAGADGRPVLYRPLRLNDWFGEQWLAAKRAAEQQVAAEWAAQFDMPLLEGPERALDWGERSRHQLMTAAHTALVVEGTWDEAAWAQLEEKARTVTRAGWWIDQRDAEGADLLELLNSAGEQDRGTENPFR
ncbi:hypothetical protein AB0D57_38105 [Streptomyces sp. NPDC048275]|uniref:hypothetical protein n=1 Tax=Streptomyces sp. NPDC048275 TaxID=3155629 RepID=UPI003404E414